MAPPRQWLRFVERIRYASVTQAKKTQETPRPRSVNGRQGVSLRRESNQTDAVCERSSISNPDDAGRGKQPRAATRYDLSPTSYCLLLETQRQTDLLQPAGGNYRNRGARPSDAAEWDIAALFAPGGVGSSHTWCDQALNTGVFDRRNSDARRGRIHRELIRTHAVRALRCTELVTP